MRMAVALYSKLQGMINELKNWNIESPANQLFDKTERYFAKASRRNTDFYYSFFSLFLAIFVFELKKMLKTKKKTAQERDRNSRPDQRRRGTEFQEA